MKYPITVTADGFALRRPRVVPSLALSDVWRFTLRHWGLLAALAITFIVHAPTLRYFFDGDDFVVLGSVEYLGTQQYLLDTVRMQDIVPNWRPLTGLVYAAEWNLFGLNAAAWRSVNLAVHLGSIAVLYALVSRVTRRPGAAAVAAIIFGVSGAHFDTVTYVTALPHVLATFFVLASLLTIVSYTQDGERNPAAFWLAVGLFTLAFLANEGAFVFAPIVALAYMLYSRRWRNAPLRLVLHVAPLAAIAIGWLTFYQTCSCEQLKFEDYYWGSHSFENFAVYLSWLVVPIRGIPASPDVMRWSIAIAVLAASLIMAIRGPHLARLAVAGMLIALLPYLPVEIWTASRYTYASVAFFAPLAALAMYGAFDRARNIHPVARVPVTALALVLMAAIASLYGWQSYGQDSRSGRSADRWLLLVNELQAAYPHDVPDGTTIYIVDGPWTNPMEQYTWVPSVARALYGDAAAFNLPRAAYTEDPPDTENALFLEWTPEGLRPVAAEQVIVAP